MDCAIVPPSEPQGHVMGRYRRILIATRFLFLLAIPAAAPASTFDGAWSVRIASSSSACGNGATASIDISHGRVASNDGMMTASGRVAQGGTISVTLVSGMKRAVGFGHLTGTSGSGTWRGALCHGSWKASKL
jgi:hypothetical protein